MNAPFLPGDRLVADPVRLRVVAALLGGAVPALVATIAWWLGVPYVAAVAGVGTPIGAALAGWLAERAVRPGWPLLILVIALGAPLLIAAVLALAGATGGPDQLVVGFAIVAAYVVILGVPVTLPTVLIAVLLLRRASGMRVRQAVRHASLLAAVAAVAGTLTLGVAVGPLAGPAGAAGLEPVDWEARSAAVRLGLVIENRTRLDRYVEVMSDLDDGSSAGLGFGVGPCETVVKRLNLESARWSIRDLDGQAAYDLDVLADGRLLATAADAPGTDPVLLVGIGPGDGAEVEAVDRLPAVGTTAPGGCD